MTSPDSALRLGGFRPVARGEWGRLVVRTLGQVAVAALLVACGVAHSGTAAVGETLGERELHVIPGTPIPPPAPDPAQAAIERWLPSRAGDEQLRALVDEAMRSGRGRKVADRAIQTVGDLSTIRTLLVDEGLPDLFLGIPYWESNFTDDAVSRSCAAGVWQLMPETAFELGVAVQNCRIGDVVWSPTPGVPASPASPYRGEGCAIDACEVDGRFDLAQSTRAAVKHLERMWRAKEVVDRDDRAGLVVIAYNTGYGAVLQHLGRAEASGGHPLDNLGECADGRCATLSPQGAHYLPGVLASAALATCAAAEVPGTRFAQDRQSALCQSLRLQGLVPDKLNPSGLDPNGLGQAASERPPRG